MHPNADHKDEQHQKENGLHDQVSRIAACRGRIRFREDARRVAPRYRRSWCAGPSQPPAAVAVPLTTDVPRKTRSGRVAPVASGLCPANVLLHRHRFTGQRRLLNMKVLASQQASIGRN